MKKQIGLLVILSVLIISCGGKNEKKEGVEIETQQVKNCGCDEIHVGKLNGKDFTGTCEDKDQKDTIVLKKNYKNGYFIYKKEKTKMKGDYIVTLDMNFEDEKEFNGYEIGLYYYSDSSSLSNGGYTKEYQEYKNGVLFNSYDVYVDKASEFGKGKLSVYWRVKNGVKLEYSYPEDETEEFLAASKPKCMPDAKVAGHYSNNKGWVMEELNNEDLFKIMAELKKELPRFTYTQ